MYFDYVLIVFLVFLPFVLIGLGVYGAILLGHKRVRNVNKVPPTWNYPYVPPRPSYPPEVIPYPRRDDDAQGR